MRTARLVTVAVLAAMALASQAGAQQPKPGPGGSPAVPQAARPGPYKPVPVTLPKPFADPSLDAFRKSLQDIAGRKDRAALATKVVAKGFFWQREDGNGADPKKSGIDNLADAIGLDAPDGTGWQVLSAAILVAPALCAPMVGRGWCATDICRNVRLVLERRDVARFYGAEPWRTCPDRIGDVARHKVAVVFFQHPRISAAKIFGDHEQRNADQDSVAPFAPPSSASGARGPRHEYQRVYPRTRW